jgi:hypothetical protein
MSQSSVTLSNAGNFTKAGTLAAMFALNEIDRFAQKKMKVQAWLNLF